MIQNKEKEPLKLTGKHFNINSNFTKPEIIQSLMKSPKNNAASILASQREEAKKAENVESLSQNLAKNKIIPSFLVQKKTGDAPNNLPLTPSGNTHLKMNNFFASNNSKNSMLKTNNTANNFVQTPQSRPAIFNASLQKK